MRFFLLISFIVFGLQIPLAANAMDRSCIAKLPRRLTSEYTLAGWGLTLPNAFGVLMGAHQSLMAYQSYNAYLSFGSTDAVEQDDWDPDNVSGTRAGTLSKFVSSYTKPLMVGAYFLNGFRMIYNARQYRAEIAPITFLSWGAYEVFSESSRVKPLKQIPYFIRKIEKSEMAIGRESFQSWVAKTGLAAHEKQLAEFIVRADQIGLFCEEDSPYLGLTQGELLDLLEKNWNEGALQKEFFKTKVGHQLERSEKIESSPRYRAYLFSDEDLAAWDDPFQKYLSEELLEEDVLLAKDSARWKADVKYYSYSVKNILKKVSPGLIQVLTPSLEIYLPTLFSLHEKAE